MTDYLVDTNVISELAPTKNRAEPAVVDFIKRMDASLYLSVITPLEIHAGILELGRREPGRRHEAMTIWFKLLDRRFIDRLLPVSREIALLAAELSVEQRMQGLQPDWPDTVIAATARHHGMTLLTRNTRHFAHTNITVINPFETLPE
ncbi:type II toxin-antitoxin system VapC family toxin [Tianweitania sp. BSSL-BM11]|uniref:Type II toxin-antitoxin system VapC family toxin n=1 Tax=Tianweitania aestuarii TaxID=2814886 RepID=A0ABS5RXJ1_9HYPH|nr:type II toxin-antitoxin system VapC family toxin [Tianweitania aestuarii]MBS9721773.1 type II toxin-antitoxin system VapC family toxin [Tianweitania aestuarii]